MNIVDDATGKTESFLTEQETTEDDMRLLWGWIDRYGIPQAVCCDKKNAYVITREPTISEIRTCRKKSWRLSRQIYKRITSCKNRHY